MIYTKTHTDLKKSLSGRLMLQELERLSEQIRALCQKHQVISLAVFGSAVRRDFGLASDVDFLVDFDNSLSASEYSNAYFSLKSDLENLLQRSVDLVTVRSLSNPYFRDAVMAEQQQLYAA